MAGYGPGTPAFDNLNPTLQAIALRIINESGGRVWVGSGWRSIEQQTDLYNRWISGNYNVPSVAKPGRSKHNHGMAIDFGGDLRLAQQLGRKYGLIFPVKGEAWHGELGGHAHDQDIQMPGGGVQYDLNYMGGQPVNPEDVLANRMHAIMRTLGGDQTSMLMEPDLMDDFGETDPEKWLESGGTPWDLAGAMFPLQMQGQGLADLEGFEERSPVFVLGYDKKAQKAQYQIADARDFGAYAKSLFKKFGFEPEDYPALVHLWNKESGDPKAGSSKVTWNPLAQNDTSTAFGIAQFLNGTWAGTGISKTTNPLQQIMAGLIYIRNRYGNPRNALNFHLRNNWY